jgi:hypothetical protein
MEIFIKVWDEITRDFKVERFDAEEIEPNVRSTTRKEVKSFFVFREGATEYELEFPKDSDRSEFNLFTVFDNKSVLAHLDEENKFEFRPAGLSFFSDLAVGFQAIESKLNDDINSKQLQDWSIQFHGESEIKKVLNQLNSNLDLSKLTGFLTWNQEDDRQIEELEIEKAKLLTLNKEKEIENVEQVLSQIEILKGNLVTIDSVFNLHFLNNVKESIENYLRAKELASREGINSFSDDFIKGIGTEEWKSFIRSAESLAKLQKNDGMLYPEKNDACLLCHQHLADGALSLIHSYWTYLKSNAEKDAQSSNQILISFQSKFKNLEFVPLTADSILAKWFDEKNPVLLSSVRSKMDLLRKSAREIIAIIEAKDLNKMETMSLNSGVTANFSVNNTLTNIDALSDSGKKEIQELRKREKKEDLKIVEDKLTLLSHKKKLNELYPEIAKYVNSHKLREKEISVRKDLSTRPVTEKEKELSKKYYGDQYSDLFDKECMKLGVNLGIKISQKSERGNSFRELTLLDKTPSSILCDGEQKVTSLADFLTEATMSPLNRGIIFDDPVTSLDEERRGVIAKRLVEESKSRQVIIFTHDLVFVAALYASAEILEQIFNAIG